MTVTPSVKHRVLFDNDSISYSKNVYVHWLGNLNLLLENIGTEMGIGVLIKNACVFALLSVCSVFVESGPSLTFQNTTVSGGKHFSWILFT